jgi:hypothetical protein
MRVLVFGGRKFLYGDAVDRVLDGLQGSLGISTIIHGGACGADSLAGSWAVLRKIPQVVFPARWDDFGKAAGILRNQQMLEQGLPEYAIAFPGGTGTADMLARVRAAGVPGQRFDALGNAVEFWDDQPAEMWAAS